MKINHFDMKMSKISNRLLFDMHGGKHKKVKFPFGNPYKWWSNEFKNKFLLDIVLAFWEIIFNFICLLFKFFKIVKPQIDTPCRHVKYEPISKFSISP